MKKTLLLLFAGMQLILSAQISSRKISASGAELGSKGVVYALPKAVIRVDVWVEKTTYTKGPYASYARDLLGLQTNTAQGDSYQLRNIQLSCTHAPDEQEMYYAFLGNFAGKSAYSQAIKFDETGAFAGISMQNNSPTPSSAVTTALQSITNETGRPPFKYYADLNTKDIVDTVYVRVDVDTAVIQKASLKHTTIQKDINARAMDAAKRYMQIHKKRIDLVSGYQEIAYDGAALKLMNEELLKLEDEYLSLFAGSYKVSDEHYSFYCVPQTGQNNTRIPVFNFSTNAGPQRQGGGQAVNIVIKSNALDAQLRNIKSSGNIEGLVYRLPQTAEVWAEYQGRSYDAQMMRIPQLGVIRAANIEDGSFELYPSTGGVKMIEIKK